MQTRASWDHLFGDSAIVPSRTACAPVVAVLAATALFAGCQTAKGVPAERGAVSLEVPRFAIPKPLRLDVNIAVFEPCEGLLHPDLPAERAAAVRQHESTYFAMQLKKTLDRAGHWGTVRLVPSAQLGAEIVVSARLLKSTGERLALKVRAWDATGRKWASGSLGSTVTSSHVIAAAANRADVFENLYHTIANRLDATRAKLSADQIQEIRAVAELRFAHAMMPRDFGGFLYRFDGGYPKGSRFTLKQKPKDTHPLLPNVRRIRAVDRQITDRMHAHYEDAYALVSAHYAGWRENHIRGIESARAAAAQPSASTAAGPPAPISGGPSKEPAAAPPGEPGAPALAAPAVTVTDLAAVSVPALASRRHVVEGRSVELTGSPAAQYGQWRDFIESLFRVDNKGELLREGPGGD